MNWLFLEMMKVHQAGKPHRSAWAALAVQLIFRHQRLVGYMAATSSWDDVRHYTEELGKNMRRLERASRRAHHPE